MARRTPTHKERVDALFDIWAFADLIGFRGGRKSFGAFHYELTDFLTQTQQHEDKDNRRRLVLAPRGHLKSTVCSVLYVLWRIYRNPDIRVLVGTNLKRLSRAFIRELRQYFEDTWLQQNVWNVRPHIEGALVPALSASDRRKRNSQRNNVDYDEALATLTDDTKLIWSMEALQVIRPTVMKEPTVQTVSIGTTVTGDHYDLLILDDIVDFENSKTEDKAENILEWTRDLESVLDPRQEHVYHYNPVANKAGALVVGKTKCEFTDFVGDEAVILGTRYFQWDYYGYLLDEAEYLGIRSFMCNIYKNGEDDKDGYLWEERFNAEVVENIKRRLNSFRRFASQYLNRIVTADEQLLPQENVQYFHPASVDVSDDGFVSINRDGYKVRVKPMLVVDPAVSQKKTADNTVLTVGGYDNDKNLYIFDVKAGKFTPSETIKHIFTLADKYKLNAVTLETVGGFALLSYQVKDAFKTHRPLAIREYRPKGDKQGRITAMLEPHWTNKSIYMQSYLAIMPELKDELDSFPLSKHDDIVDTFAIICELSTPTRKEGQKRSTTPRRMYNTRYGGRRA
ncbi:terminase [Leptolyngbya phage Lbo-JY12]